MDNLKLQEAMQTYVNDQSRDNLLQVLNQLRNAHLFVPSVFPEGTDLSAFSNVAPGEKLNIPENVRPIPSVLKNDQGEQYLPLYTSADEIPKKQVYHTLAEISFQAGYQTVLSSNDSLAGVAVNPFHENIMLKAPLLQSLKEQDEAAKNQKQVQMTPEQLVAFIRRDLELKKIPAMLYEQKEAFIEKLKEEKESFFGDLYKGAYPSDMPNGYVAEDFSIMILNVTDDITLNSIDLPGKNRIPGLGSKLYITWNEATKEARYFVIIEAPQGQDRILAYVNEAGEFLNLGVAPVEGAEMQSILELAQKENLTETKETGAK